METRIEICEMTAQIHGKPLDQKYKAVLVIGHKSTVRFYQQFKSGEWGQVGSYYLSTMLTHAADGLCIDCGQSWDLIGINKMNKILIDRLCRALPSINQICFSDTEIDGRRSALAFELEDPDPEDLRYAAEQLLHAVRRQSAAREEVRNILGGGQS
jgi:hypothetical protein